MHGDLVPWNLREDKQGQLWLLDWEDAGWGPPFADVVRFLVAYHSLGWRSPHRIASHVSSLAAASPDVLREVAQFWLRHRNVQPGNWPRQSAIDAARKRSRVGALRAGWHRLAQLPASAFSVRQADFARVVLSRQPFPIEADAAIATNLQPRLQVVRHLRFEDDEGEAVGLFWKTTKQQS